VAQLGSQSWTGPNNTHWGDGFDLTPAFVLVYGTTELQEMQDEAMFLYRPDVGDGP